MAQRLIGVKEVKGNRDNPFIEWCLELDRSPSFLYELHDEIPWCSAFANRIAWLFRLSRSKSWMARSWIGIGQPIDPVLLAPGYDVVVFSRGSDPTLGHVGFFAGMEVGKIWIVGGNQTDAVTLEAFPYERAIAFRRLISV